MSFGIHEASLPTLARALRNASACLDKAAAWAVDKQQSTPASLNIEQGLTQSRLVPDMFPMARQVQIATDMAKGCAARLAGIEPPRYEDTESTLAELKARLTKTIAFIESVDRHAVDGSAQRSITIKTGGQDVTFTGGDYVTHFVLPNVFFHLTMAYALLRQAGVPLGKRDFLGG